MDFPKIYQNLYLSTFGFSSSEKYVQSSLSSTMDSAVICKNIGYFLGIMNQKLSQFSKTAGPGILFASTAIGVSHLVQSTKAGADFGLLLLGFVILVTLLKYPFFEYGSRYVNST